MSKYPPADSTTQWFEDNFPGALMNPNVLVLHTTEGTTWPGYEGGATAPNYTARPDLGAKRLHWRQHYPDERSSRSLVNAPGGVETNTLNCIQVELVGTCDPAHRTSWGNLRAGHDYVFWPDAPDWLLRELAKFVAYCHRRHGVKLQAPTFKAYPGSAGTNNGVRMTGTQWRNFYGVCGHQHVPENVHGDPGNTDVPKVLEFAKAIIDPAPPPPPPPAPADLVLEECALHTEEPQWAAQMPAQVEAALKRGASVIGLTELAASHPALRKQAADLATKYGYRAFFSDGDSALLYKAGLGEATAASVATATGQGYCELSFMFHGRRVTVFATHWKTNKPENQAARAAMTTDLIARMREAAAGNAIAFYMGDSNPSKPLSDPAGEPRTSLDAAGMPLVYEDLGSFPGGIGVTAIGHSARDKAVTAKAVVVGDALGSDHRPVTVTYSVAPIS